MPISYELVEADAVQASHLAHAGFQKNPHYALENERRYHDEPGSKAKVLENALRLDPAFLLSSVDANHGAPVLDQQGNVLGGNGRAMSIQYAYEGAGKSAKAYRDALRANADALGLTPSSIEGMERPMLVRRVNEDISPEARQALVTAMNDDFKDSREKKSEGITRGERLSPTAITMLAEGMKDAETGSLREFFDSTTSLPLIEQLMQDGVLQKTERNALIAADGLLNPDGKTKVEAALRVLYVNGRETLSALPDGIKAKMDVALPHMLLADKVGGEWAILQDVREANDLIVAYKASGHKEASTFLNQVDMMKGKSPSQDASPLALGIFTSALEDKKAVFAEHFKRYANEANLSTGLGIGKSRARIIEERFGVKRPAELKREAKGKPVASASGAAPQQKEATKNASVQGAMDALASRKKVVERPNDGKPVRVVDVDPSAIPVDLSDTKGLVAWLRDYYGGSTVSIRDTGEIAKLTNRGLRESAKRRGVAQRQGYAALDTLLEEAVYDGFEAADARHVKKLKGQNVYFSAMRMGDRIYSVKFKMDVPLHGDGLHYKDHKVSEIEMAPTLYQSSKSKGSYTLQNVNAISEVSLSVLKGEVNPSLHGAGIVLASRKKVPAGSTTVGRIDEDMAKGLPLKKSGDIRLDAEGIAHIEEKHGKDIRAVGFADAKEFVQHVAKNFDYVYQGTGPRDVALVVHGSNNSKRAILKLEFAPGGDFYRVKTAGPVGSGFYKNKSLLWERAPTSQLLKESPNAISGQSSTLGENGTLSDTEVNELASITPGQFLPQRRAKALRVRATAVQRVADKLGNKAKNAAPVRVVQAFSEIPEHIQTQYAASASAIEGVYDPQTKTVWLVADNLSDVGRAAEVWAHEQIVHHGLRGMFSDIERKQVLTQLWTKLGGMSNELISEVAGRYGVNPRIDAKARESVMEEVIATLAEKRMQSDLTAQEEKWWQRVVDAVLRAWANMVHSVSSSSPSMKAADIDVLLSALGKYVMNGDTQRYSDGVFSPASLRRERQASEAAYMAWEQLQEDTEAWGRQVDDYRPTPSGEAGQRELLTVCSTPDVLQKLGAPDLPMTMTHDNLKKILSDKPDHGLPKDLVKQLPEALADPIMVFESATQAEAFVVLTELRYEGRYVMAAVHLDAERQRIRVNEVASAYRRGNEAWYIRQIEEGRLLYQDKNKSLAWARTKGLQLPRVRKLPARLSDGRILTEKDVVKPVPPKNDDMPMASLASGVTKSGKPLAPSGFSAAELQNPVLAGIFEKIGKPKPTMKEKWGAFKEGLALRMEQGIFDQFASIKSASAEGYKQARMTTSLGTQMQSMMEFGAPVWKDGGVVPKGKGLAEVFKPVSGELDRFLYWMVGNRAARLKSEGRENLFTDEEITALQALNGGKGTDGKNRAEAYKKVFDDFATFKRRVLDFAQEGGLVNPETRGVWENADYIPFYRVHERMEGSGVAGPRGKGGLTGQKSGVHTLKGGLENIGDPLENIMRNFSHLVDAAQKNRAAVTIMRDLEAGGFAERLSPAEVYADMQVQGRQLMEALKSTLGSAKAIGSLSDKEKQSLLAVFNPRADFVAAMVDGSPRWFTVNDPLLHRAITNMRPTDGRRGPLWNLLRGARLLLTTGVTVMPDFMLRNFFRDAIHSWAVEHKSGFIPLVDSIKNVANVYQLDDDIKTLLASGSAFMGSGYRIGSSTEEAAKALEKTLKKYGKDKDSFDASVLDTTKKIAQFFSHAWEKYEKVSSASENSARLAIYKKLKAKGYSEGEAAFQAKDIMDFTMRGEWEVVRALTEVVPFLGARLAGLHRMGRGVMEDKRAFFYKGVTISALSVALYAVNLLLHGDEWDKLEDWDRDTYYHFWIGDKHVRLPKPFEVGFLFGTVPERIAEQLMTTKPGSVAISRMAHGLMEQLAFDPTPQLFKPFIEVEANRDFFRDRPIESMGMERKLPVDRYTQNTSLVARGIAGAMDTLLSPIAGKTGLDNLRSPARIEHLIKGYLGGIGMSALGISDLVIGALTGAPVKPDSRPQDLPLIRAFFKGSTGDVSSTRYTGVLYNNLKRANLLQASLKAGGDAGENVRELRAQYSADDLRVLALRSQMNAAARNMSKIRKQEDLVRASTRLNSSQKREQLDALSHRKNDIAKRIVLKIEAR